MKKIMFIGAVGTGKTTLTQRIQGHDITYKKTQAIEASKCIIDTPGEFVQRRQFYSALQVTSSSVDCIGILQCVDEKFNTFPPGFGSMFSKPVIGIITKMDKTDDPELIKRAEQSLRNSGARQIFKVSSIEDEGMKELLAYLEYEEE